MTEIHFCPVCRQEVVGNRDCPVCASHNRDARRQEAMTLKAAVPIANVPEDLEHFLGHNGIRGEQREDALAMMGALNGVGFNVHSSFPWWMTWTSEKGEEVFADSFFDQGKCRLLWKDLGSEDTAKAVLELCSLAGVPAYFPFAFKEPTNG